MQATDVVPDPMRAEPHRCLAYMSNWCMICFICCESGSFRASSLLGPLCFLRVCFSIKADDVATRVEA
jgi:hypothetical protein